MITRWTRRKPAAVGVDAVRNDDRVKPAWQADNRFVAIADDECLKKLHDLIALHRHYGWNVYQYREIPAEAILVLRVPNASNREGAQTDTGRVPSQRRWCRIWVDEFGEVRWQSISMHSVTCRQGFVDRALLYDNPHEGDTVT